MDPSDQFPEVREIADAVCAESVTQEQLSQLKQLLKGNFAAQEFYYDYLNLHIQLLQPADRNMEFVYRRMTQTTAEEFVMRPKDSDDASRFDSTKVIEPPKATSDKNAIKILALVAIIITCLVVLLFYRNTSPSTSTHVAQLLSGNLSIIGHQAKLNGDTLSPGIYLAKEKVTIQLVDGDTIHMAPYSRIKLYNNHEVKTVYGKYTFESSPGQNTIIHNNDFILGTNGSNLTLDLRTSGARVATGKNTTLTPAYHRPIHYWNFEGKGDRVIDFAGEAYGITGSGATITKGKLGKAMNFDNSTNAHIELGSGGGTVLGTGSFALTNGVTIEALIRPNFSGELSQHHQIFSQVYGDKDLRMSLGFHRRIDKDRLTAGANGQTSLNFGLFLIGQGYQELTLPLDGKNGRPRLADIYDNNFHHLVATYHASQGLKALYIDGKKYASAQYPAGSKVLTGGAGSTVIGNSAIAEHWHKQAFSGAIDDVALYDFALPEYTIGIHLQNIHKGKNYYGSSENSKTLPDRSKIELPPYTTLQLDKETKLPRKIVDN